MSIQYYQDYSTRPCYDYHPGELFFVHLEPAAIDYLPRFN